MGRAATSIAMSQETMGSARLVVVLGVLLVGALFILRLQSLGSRLLGGPDNPLITLLLTLLALLIGVPFVRGVGALIAATSFAYLGTARARVANALTSVVLYILLGVAVASQTRLDLSGIALSGAVTGVVVGIAAQASFSNVVSGLVLVFARPIRPGEFVTTRAAAFAGVEYSGEVGEISLFYTTLLNGSQEIRVPNSSMVSSVVVVRPQALDIYVPLVLPLARWEVLSTTGLIRQLREALPEHRHIEATIERLDEATVQIGIRASVANDGERSQFERALLGILRAGGADGGSRGERAGELHEL